MIGLAILGICIWANGVGALVPLLAKRFGIDPALVSAPLISTLVDATGLVIYYYDCSDAAELPAGLKNPDQELV